VAGVDKPSPSGFCTSQPNKKCKAAIIKHAEHDMCPSTSDEATKFLNFIGAGNVNVEYDVGGSKETITIKDVKLYKTQKDELENEWKAFEASIKAQKMALRQKYEKQCKTLKENKIEKGKSERLSLATTHYAKLADSMKDFNNKMGDIVENLVQNACSGNTQNGYDRMVVRKFEAQKDAVREAKLKLIFDSIAAIFAIIGKWIHTGVHNITIFYREQHIRRELWYQRYIRTNPQFLTHVIFTLPLSLSLSPSLSLSLSFSLSLFLSLSLLQVCTT